MIQNTQNNNQNISKNVIKLSLNNQARSDTSIRSLKSSAIMQISQLKNPQKLQNQAINIERKQILNQSPGYKITQSRNLINGNKGNQVYQRQSLFGNSREVHRISGDFDDGMRRSHQKYVNGSNSKIQYKSPVLNKQEIQYNTQREQQNVRSLNNNKEYEIKQLYGKIQYYENECRNLKNQNDQLHRSLGAPQAMLQRELQNKIFRIQDLENRLQVKTKEHADKCLENQKNISRIHELDNISRRNQTERQRLLRELTSSRQNVGSLSKQLGEFRINMIKLESDKKKLGADVDDQKRKNMNLIQDKKQLEIELQKVEKIKVLVRQLQQSDNENSEVIKKHIAYQVELIESNSVIVSNLQMHKHDIKTNNDKVMMFNRELEAVVNQIGLKMKDVLDQKSKLEKELLEARQETQKIRKSMFVGYQEIINGLRDELIKLKEQNVYLSNNSDQKVSIIKLQRQIQLLVDKNDDLMNRNKQLEVALQRYIGDRKGVEIQSDTSIKGYDREGVASLESIVLGYESSRKDLNERIFEKEVVEARLKKRIEELEGELNELKGEGKLASKIEKADASNLKIRLQAMQMQYRLQTDSLRKKIEGLQDKIQSKSKQIKQKDSFMTSYLLQKVKGEISASQIVEEIDKYFNDKGIFKE